MIGRRNSHVRQHGWHALFLAFVAMMAASPLRAEDAATPSIAESPITTADREHWAFRPLRRSDPPQVENADWARNPIDRFILAKLEASSLAPMPAADRTTLIRRVSFDLIGLPPTPEQIDAFLADRADGAYERLVARLLGTRAYGERWAQHWLDLARFAETDGFEHDKIRKQAWRYRDWVIDALNRDLPYDQFVQRQLAGDELFADEPEASIPTSFCLSGPDMPDINSQEERRDNLLSELTGTVGAVFLGLQIGCAQCHDHKYDPISQADFYRLRSVFEPAVQVKSRVSVDVMREKPGKVAPSYLRLRGEWNRRGPEVSPAFPRIANPWNDPVAAPVENLATSGRRAALAKWITRPDHPLATRVIVNRLWQYHFGQGLSRSPSDFGTMGSEPSHPELLDYLASELPRLGWSLKAMHRLIVNSTTYRQASRADGTGLSEAERHAVEERLGALRRIDPDNELLGRANRRRMEGEAIRDAMLAASGSLSRRTGGPGVMPPLPAELTGTLLRDQWKVSPDAEDHRRRSIYIFARRNLRYPVFDVFDRPDGNASCARRGRSTTATQSLLMLNSRFSLDCARRMAGHVLQHADDVDARIKLLYRCTLGRAPQADELASSREFLASQTKLLQSENRPRKSLALPEPCPSKIDPFAAAAFSDLCLAVYNLSEFVYVD